MIGYACRSKNSNTVCIAIGTKMPSLKKEGGWFWHLPGWFATMNLRTFKKKFGFTIEPGTVKKVEFSISLKK